MFLQGPMGPFFRRFASELADSGIKVSKINFNAADAFYYRGLGAVAFRGAPSEWGDFFQNFILEHGIDAVFLFGDCRPMHKEAVRVARAQGIAVWVFEEGYLRPDHITLEPDGVNGNSTLPKDPDFYRDTVRGLPEPEADSPVGHTFFFAAWYASVYAWVLMLGRPFYRRYRHHRNLNPFVQTFYWWRGWARKAWFKFRERGILARCQGEWSGDYYLVPLQVHNDYQIEHSDYQKFEEFIDEVVESFSKNAPPETRLILKHHPQDRAYRDYTGYLAALAKRHGCEDRVIYVHDLHLPTLLKNARGTITMNSTVGTSSLYHRTPVKSMGRAIYDVPGLTSTRSLAEFFVDCGEVDVDLYRDFNRYLREANQINGSFYKKTPDTKPEKELRLMVYGSANESGAPSVVSRKVS